MHTWKMSKAKVVQYFLYAYLDICYVPFWDTFGDICISSKSDVRRYLH